MNPLSVFCLYMGILLLACTPARADVGALNELAGMDTERFRWAEPQAAHVYGVPIHWREFSSSAALFSTAQKLAGHGDRFQRVIAYNNSVLLTGIRADWHWLAEIQQRAGGAHGRVSILQISPKKLEHLLQKRSGQAFPWLSKSARLRFSQESEVDGRRVMQQVYGASLSAGDFTAYLQRHLRSSGWQHEAQMAWWPRAEVWRRASSSLLVASLPMGPDSAVFLQHIE
ncbi:MAG TPA: hypothetical protein VNT00_01660 [Eoetvoesiella sp.]|jgi:hypothetical protein|uniref:hypothetical protein n=1 Tax=Eoetvoesiella sp. TaxID=1966355 RepID=UPI002D06066D|nr:hypothetical protein [Eoetvoesiella sp.]HWK60100.1 hypothetical protein [Eoetvoesiella sp.]